MKKLTLQQYLPFLILLIIAICALFVPLAPNFDDGTYNSSDIAFVLICAALVFLMTPALSFFYGGMVNRKNVLSTMMKSFVATGVITVLWIVMGFSLAFGDSIYGIIGDPRTFFFFQGVNSGPAFGTIPLSLFAVFQLMFAIITPGLVVGAVAERIRFTSYILFIVLFAIFVYSPLAHWTWSPNGFLLQMGVLDFAGGTVVHISAGMAALAGALVLKRRKSHLEHKEVPPANIPYVLIGTGLLWFGWFGFNAGSALAANSLAVSAFITTNIAAGAAGLSWMLFDVARGKKPSVLGFCIGAVVGLVAITPAAGFVSIPSSIFIGTVSAVISNLVVAWKQKTSLDDTLDVFPCHGIGGIVGMILTGVFATTTVNSAGQDGLLYGNADFFFTQVKGAVIVIIFSFVVSFVIFKIVNLIQPIRVSEAEEELGLDESQHNEKYNQGNLSPEIS
ncbi:ammonium transporter [Sphingobacterium hungaricum]|uniref:Ammonium transporter n=1 Tax=Sphingobacterium hungaricum TaxID=2082723 RepID=A0A928YPY6_9SPHI|nr:ammonium transporter [Sphingobacterium hungaricum]MBE8712395.1 ammonia channel protein [Sphingobacterium hungaricum]